MLNAITKMQTDFNIFHYYNIIVCNSLLLANSRKPLSGLFNNRNYWLQVSNENVPLTANKLYKSGVEQHKIQQQKIWNGEPFQRVQKRVGTRWNPLKMANE